MENRVDELLTIIVPAYNVEKYIAECLDSLVNQTKRNHKIIIVNDGSTDGTETICLDYKNKYSDLITYIYQDNKGLGGARNTGMKEVKTPYLCFLDSDDWLNIRYVEKFTQLIKNTDEKPDIVFTLPWVYDTVTNCVTPWMDKKLYEKIFEVKHG
ncbi:glycosyltransferase family 2 protein, partial [Clostridium sp. CAG:43]|uniref:glycosyltransferase family 2 protein n=1 Tax=Clostridium sp. CAG:43 TaxID=1262805 RepID=UPI0025881FAB